MRQGFHAEQRKQRCRRSQQQVGNSHVLALALASSMIHLLKTNIMKNNLALSERHFQIQRLTRSVDVYITLYGQLPLTE